VLAFATADAATPDPTDSMAAGKLAVYGPAILGTALGGAIWWGGNKLFSESATDGAPPPVDTPASAGDKLRDGARPAAGASGKKGELEKDGGAEGAHGDFDGVDGTNERSPRPGTRVKDLDGGTIETHPSTKSPDYPQGTQTVKVKDANQNVTTTVRYPKVDK
jgi:hypothetical protein